MLAVLTAILAIALAGGSASAASPEVGTVGGRLAAVDHTVTVTSQGTLPVRVTMSAEVVDLTLDSFDLQPGETRELSFTGDPVGRVYATFSTRTTADASDSNSLTLSVGLKPYTPPFDWTPVGLLILLSTACVLVALRVRPWEFRLARR